MRCFKNNPAEFVNRPPLDPFGDDAVANLKKLCSGPDPGYIWKLDDEPPEGPWLRGIIAELDLKYHEYASWMHLPTAEGVDFVKDAVAVQVKTTRSNSADTISRMKKALRDLRDAGRSRGCSNFELDIRKIPGLDTSAMQSELETYIASVDFGLLEGEEAYVGIREYEFIPRQ